MINLPAQAAEAKLLGRVQNLFGEDVFDGSIALDQYRHVIETNHTTVDSLESAIVNYSGALNIPFDKTDFIVRKLEPEVLSLCGLPGMVDSALLSDFLPGMRIMAIVLLIDELVDGSDSPETFFPLIKALAENKTEHTQTQNILDLIDLEVESFAPEDRALVRKLAFEDILMHGFNMKVLSSIYNRVKEADPYFINNHSEEIVENSVAGIGLQTVSSFIYLSLYRNGIVTTPLAEVSSKYRRLMEVAEGYLRFTDDYRDREGDLDRIINICNTENGQLIQEFMLYCKIDSEGYIPGDDSSLFKAFIAAIKQELAQIGAGTQDEEMFKHVLLRIVTVFSQNLIKDPALESVFKTQDNS